MATVTTGMSGKGYAMASVRPGGQSQGKELLERAEKGSQGQWSGGISPPSREEVPVAEGAATLLAKTVQQFCYRLSVEPRRLSTCPLEVGRDLAA